MSVKKEWKRRVEATSSLLRRRSPRNAVGVTLAVVVLSAVSAGCAVPFNVALPGLPGVPSLIFEIISTNPGGTEALPDGFAGSTYSFVISTRGGTTPLTSCSITSPPGTTTQPPINLTVTVNPANNTQCLLSGTISNNPGPIPAGGSLTFSFTVRAADSSAPALSDTQDYTLRVFAGFAFTTTTLENGTVGRAYLKTITTNLGGGVGVPPLTACSATGLPAGLNVTFAGNNCTLSGTPTASGTFSVTFTATDSGGNTRTSAALTLVINAVLAIPAPVLDNGTEQRAFGPVNVPFSGGQAPYACSGAGLPAGLNVPAAPSGNNCQITGTPTVNGAFSVTITVTDSATPTTAAGAATSAPASPLTINAVLTIITAPALPDGVMGRTYTLTLASSGGNPPVSWSNPTGGAGTLNTANPACNGLSLSAGGGISGTSTAPAAGACSFDARVTDTATATTAAGSVLVTFTINVQPALAAVLTQAGNATPNVSLFDGALGRSYGVIGATPTWTASGGLGTYGWCVSTGAASLPGGMVGISTNCGAPTAGGVVTLTSANVTGASGVFFFTVQLSDGGNAAVPPGNVLNNTLININTALTFTQSVGTRVGNAVTMLDGVELRPYGTSPLDPARVNAIYTAAGGISPYLLTGAITGPGLPAPFTCFPLGASQVTCHSSGAPLAAGTSGAGPYTFDLTATDTGNPATPAAAVTLNNSLTVQPPLALAINQAAPADAVQGRSYGQGAFTPIRYTASGGLSAAGGLVFTTPANQAAPGPGFPNGFSCAFSTAVDFDCTSGGVTGAPGTYTPINVTVDDAANATTPSSQTTGTSATIGTSLTVRDPLIITAVALANGTQGRAFGPVNVPFSGGIGATACSGGGLPAGMTVTTAAPFCQIGSTPTANGAFSVTASVTDTANVSTPAATATTANMPLTVNAPLAITTTSPLPGATTNVAYSQPFANTGGESPFTWSIIAGAQFTGNVGNVGTPCEGLSMNASGNFSGTPPNVGTCGPFTVQVADTATATTAAGSTSAVFTVDVTTALVVNPFTLENGTQGRAFAKIITVAGGTGTLRADPNGCTISGGALPSGLAINRNPGNANECLISGTPTVNGLFSVTVQADDQGGPGLASFGPVNLTVNPTLALGALNLSNGTEGRAFGGAPSTIPITGGEAPYSCSDGGTLPAGLVVAAVGSDCVISGTPAGSSSGGSPYAVVITVTDTATATTAAGSDPSNVSNININAPLVITTGAGLPDGVEGRTYTLTLTAAGGENPLTWSQVAGQTLADDPGCAGLTFNAAGDIGGSTTSVGIGSCTFQVRVDDTATTTTASGNDTLVLTMTIQPPLTINTTTLPNGLRNFTYFPTGSPGATVVATGGTGSPTSWAVTAGPFTLVAGNFNGDAATPCEGLTIGGTGTPLDTLITGTPVNPGTCSFTLQVSDSGSGPAPGGSDSQALSIIVLNTFAYAAGTGTDSVEVFNTTTNTFVTSIGLGAGTGPESVTVTTDGRFAYVTLRTTGQLAAIDTTTNTQVAGSPFNLTSCAAPRGITAVNLVGLGERVYVACDGDTVVGWDVATNTQVATITPVSTSAGVPYGIAVTPDQSTLYVTIDLGVATNGEVAVIDTATDSVTTQVALSGDCVGPRGIAVSPNGLEAYAACSGQVAGTGRATIIDTDPASITFNANVFDYGLLGTTGARVPEAVAFTPDGARAFVTLGGTGGGLPEFSVLDVAARTAQGVVGSGLSVPNPAVAPAGNTLPMGVAIPNLTPVPATGFRVYMAMRGNVASSNAPGLAVINDALPTPTANTSIAATAASALRGLAVVPPPR